MKKIILGLFLLNCLLLVSCAENESKGETIPSISEIDEENNKEIDEDIVITENDLSDYDNKTTITLGDEVLVDGSGVTVSNSVISIEDKGIYTLQGELSNGYIYINTDKKVTLLLNNVTITNTSGPAIFAEDCKKLFIELKEDTINTLTDGKTNLDTKGTIFANDSIIIYGTGTLNVNGNYKHGIVSDDDIEINGGIINIEAVTDGLHVNDYIAINGGETSIKASSDGIESEVDVFINAGKLNINASGDGIKAQNNLEINNGSILITNAQEGLEGVNEITINNCYLIMNTIDDGINAGKTMTINNGYIYVESSSNDAIDSNGSIVINGGIIYALGAKAPETGIDCDNNTILINGGIVIGMGGGTSSVSSSSKQNSVVLGGCTQGDVVQIVDEGSNSIITFKAVKSYSTLLFSSPDLTLNKNYTLRTGGTIKEGTNFNEVIFFNTGYLEGTQLYSFTQTSVAVGQANSEMGGRPGNNRPGGFR